MHGWRDFLLGVVHQLLGVDLYLCHPSVDIINLRVHTLWVGLVVDSIAQFIVLVRLLGYPLARSAPVVRVCCKCLVHIWCKLMVNNSNQKYKLYLNNPSIINF